MKKRIYLADLLFFILWDYLITLFFLFFPLFSGIGPQNAFADENPDDELCCQCHSKICEEALFKVVVHAPFLQQRCVFCHVDDSPAKVKNAKQVVVDKRNDSSVNVTWLDHSLYDVSEQWFVIPFDLLNSNKLIVHTYESKTSTSHQGTLLIPDVDTLQLKINDYIPPVIESVGVIGVYRGSVVSAKIGWTTDKASDSEIRYGIETLQESVKRDNFTAEHEIDLQDLQANQTYKYSVISRDIFGNMAESETRSFSTEIFSSPVKLENKQCSETGFQLDAQFFRNEDSYIIKITTNTPVVLSLGIEKENEEVAVSETVKGNIPNHLPMRSLDEISVSVCLTCHAGFTTVGNHKVNVHPPAAGIVPAGYLLSSEGNVTCVTCHANHSSDNECRLRFRYINGYMKAGKYSDVETARAKGGCFICHPSKGVISGKCLPPKKQRLFLGTGR